MFVEGVELNDINPADIAEINVRQEKDKDAAITWSADNKDEISMTIDAESPIPSEKGMEFYVNGDKVSRAVAMALDPEKIITVDVKKQNKDGVSTGQVWIAVKE